MYELTAGRIAASLMKEACRINLDIPSSSLIKKICYRVKFRSIATDWGIERESKVSKLSLSDKRIYSAKKTKTFFNYKMKIKTTTTTRLIIELKYSSMSKGNTCIAEPNLELLPLRIIQ